MRHFAAAVLASLALPSGASAALPPSVPMELPPAGASTASTETWLIGAKPGVTVPGQRIGNAYAVPAAQARAIAHRLGDRLTFAEPDVPRRFRAVADDPLTRFSRWRDAVIDPRLDPPPVTPRSPLLALVDAQAQATHPEFAGGNARSLLDRKVQISHGTQTMGVAVAPQNDIGIVGAYPGARAINVGLPATSIPCSASARNIRRSVKAGADVINMSYGSLRFCHTEYVALQYATRRGVTLVAAAGNERRDGNPYEYPASLPHVLTVGALTPDDRGAAFSNTTAAMDLLAPGVGIIAPTPRAFDRRDGDRNGYEVVSGTSFAAPIVSAAAVWLRAARPKLKVDQVAQVIRLSAKDIFRKGYDTETGYGKLNMSAALARKAPFHDPLEPNDDLGFVDGRFGDRARAVWTGGRAFATRALLDRFEDPADVYRIKVPGRSRARIQIRPMFGNPDLEVFRAGTRSLRSGGGLVAASRRRGDRTDQVRVRNSARGSRTALVAVFTGRGRVLDAGYRLSIK